MEGLIMIKHEHKKEKKKGVEHTETLTQVGVNVGIPPYQVGFFFNRQKITDKPVEIEKPKSETETENPNPGD